MGANQHLVIAGEELAHSAHLGWVNPLLIGARCVAQIPLRFHRPVRPETEL